jgi:hypothetical protein
VVWAALDCPGYFAVADGRLAVLGRMAAAIDAYPAIGATYVVLGWPIAREGRKLRAGTALFDAAGTLLARSQQTWIVIDSAAGLTRQGGPDTDADALPDGGSSR